MKVKVLSFKKYIRLLQSEFYHPSIRLLFRKIPLGFYTQDGAIYLLNKDDMFKYVFYHELGHHEARERLAIKIYDSLRLLRPLWLGLISFLIALLCAGLIIDPSWKAVPTILKTAVGTVGIVLWAACILLGILSVYDEYLAENYAYEKMLEEAEEK